MYIAPSHYTYTVMLNCLVMCHNKCTRLFSVFSGIFQSSTFGFAGMLPPGYITAVMKGQVILNPINIERYGHSLSLFLTVFPLLCM